MGEISDIVFWTALNVPKMATFKIPRVLSQLMLFITCLSVHNQKALSDDPFTNNITFKICLLLEI